MKKYAIVVERPGSARAGAQEVLLDGRVLEGEWVELVDDGERHAVVVRPRRAPLAATSNIP